MCVNRDPHSASILLTHRPMKLRFIQLFELLNHQVGIPETDQMMFLVLIGPSCRCV